jgi:predicted nucleic acid-binding protein
MKYVLDASVALKWELPESDSAKAIVLRDNFVARVDELIAPDFFPVEVAHALVRAERKNVLTSAEGAQALQRMLQQLPQLFSAVPLLTRAYEIASQARMGVYDCVYVALAERESCSLVTSDQRLLSLTGYPVVALAGT